MDKKRFAEKFKGSFNKLAGYAIWILILLLALSVIRNVGRRARIEAEIDAERAKVIKMQEDNKRLAEEVLQAQSGDFIERQIRNKLGLVKDGEAIVVLPDEEILRDLAPQALFEEDTLPDPNWKKWLKLFL
jgi:cell division protein FtsB